MKVITVSGVNKTYGSFLAVNDMHFEVSESSCVGLLGPNGAGKSTMMKMIYGKARRDEKPASTLSVFGYDPKNQELNIKSLSGVVPQENNLDDELNVVQNLRIFSKLYGIPHYQSRHRIETLLAFMELSEKKQSKIRELSGGMKRRLTIARALINSPRLLILDEPTTGLDPQVRHMIWDKLRQLNRDGVTVLLTTHYMEEAFQICDHIIIMNKGRKVMEGHPSKLIRDNIEGFVLEILHRKDVNLVEPYLDHFPFRRDESHEVTLFYAQDIQFLKLLTEKLNPGTFYLRQSNLEDLFLKLTGRTLNE